MLFLEPPKNVENKRKTGNPLWILGFLIWWSRGESNPCLCAYNPCDFNVFQFSSVISSAILLFLLGKLSPAYTGRGRF
nr:MAG TPA: hypothetical protein [Caudoviricetes sp.]